MNALWHLQLLEEDRAVGGGVAPAPVPGKNSLTQRMMPGRRRLQLAPRGTVAPAVARAPVDDPFALHTAAAGVSGASEPVPYAGQLQPLLPGVDLSSVRAYRDDTAQAAAARLGARAYATDDAIVLPREAPLELVAHEVAHVAQQRGGTAPTVGRAGDAFEQHADLVAATVARGESAGPLLAASPGMAPAVACAPAEASASASDAASAEPEAAATGDATLDEVMGDGMEEEIDALAEGVFSAVATAQSAVAAWSPEDAAYFEPHLAGAEALTEHMYAQIDRLLAGASVDDSGEVTSNPQQYAAVMDAMARCEAAIAVLGCVTTLAAAPELRAVAAALAAIGQLGADKVAEIVSRAKLGHDLLEQLTKMFAEHQHMLDKYLASACKDLISIVPGGVAKTEWLSAMKTLQAGAKQFGDAWSYYGLFEKVVSPPKTTWDTVKAMKSFGKAIAKPIVATLAKDTQLAYADLMMIIDVMQAYLHIGLAAGELAVMQTLLTEARRIRDEFGPIMRFVADNQAMLATLADWCDRLKGASAGADAVLARAEAAIDTAMRGWGDLYHPQLV